MMSLQVSVVTFKLFHGHMIIQNSERGSVISAELGHVEPCEHGNISIDKFQQLFTAGGASYSLHSLWTGGTSQVYTDLSEKLLIMDSMI